MGLITKLIRASMEKIIQPQALSSFSIKLHTGDNVSLAGYTPGLPISLTCPFSLFPLTLHHHQTHCSPSEESGGREQKVTDPYFHVSLGGDYEWKDHSICGSGKRMQTKGRLNHHHRHEHFRAWECSESRAECSGLSPFP